MNHSAMQHEQIMNHQIQVVSSNINDIGIHQHHLPSSFWTLFNSIEIIFIALIIVLFIFKRNQWQRHPFITSLTALFFFLSMNPITDSIARHSIWLHCLQSSFVHHLIPLTMLITISPQKSILSERPSIRTNHLTIVNIIAFNAMSLMWILPTLHLRLMQDALLYSAMKWAMVLTGVFLCSTIQAFNNYKIISGLTYQNFNLLVLLPQLIIGLALMILPPLYAMPSELMQHAHFNSLAQILPDLSEQHDQMIGGFILILASTLFVLLDSQRRHKFFKFTPSLPSIHKEVI